MPNKDYKIALICGHFMPEIGYQEVFLAAILAKQNYKIRVFTSTCISPSAIHIIKSRYPEGLSPQETNGYDILRLKPWLKLGSNVISRGLKKSIKQFQPDLIIIIGVGKFFPLPLLNSGVSRQYKIVTLLGNNYDMRIWKKGILNTLKRKLIFVLKKPLYNKAIKNSSRIITYTSSTDKILQTLVNPSLHNELALKSSFIPLGFNPEQYYFSETERKEGRDFYGIPPEGLVFITATRVNAEKKIKFLIDSIEEIQQALSIPVYYFIVGSMNNSYSEELYVSVNHKKLKTSINFLNFLPHDKVRKLCCMADFGIWARATISIQQAMGTGLPVILPDNESVKHLINPKINGILFKNNIAESVLKDLNIFYHTDSDRIAFRKKNESFNNSFLNYEYLAKQIIGE